MTAEELGKLQRTWAGRLRAGGFHDIESPCGMIRSRAIGRDRGDELAAQLAFLADHVFGSELERRAWELKTTGHGARTIAVKLHTYRKRVALVLARLTAAMRRDVLRPRRKPGRPRDENGLRAEGLRQSALLSPAARLALDHLCAVQKVSQSEAVRRALVDMARRVSLVTK